MLIAGCDAMSEGLRDFDVNHKEFSDRVYRENCWVWCTDKEHEKTFGLALVGEM